MKKLLLSLTAILIATLVPTLTFASDSTAFDLDLTDSAVGLTAVGVFLFSYLFVMSEEFTHLRKSKPVVLAAGVIWVLVALAARDLNLSHAVEQAVRHNLLEYAELFLFLLVAMTYVNVMEDRLVFEALRSYLVRKGFSNRALFWVTGIIAFCMSPVADNLTTALIMCAVVMAVGNKNKKFISLSCINIVVAANAGGAFSPFGDITTLMVWQKNILHFNDFFNIFFPSLIGFLIPASFMHFAIPETQLSTDNADVKMKFGAKRVIGLFILTIITAVSFHNLLHLPPVVGMMTGLGYLNFFAYYMKKVEHLKLDPIALERDFSPFDIFNKIKRAEWDTLFFFYGVILCVGGLATFGYLELMSTVMYTQWGAALPAIHQATPANVFVGLLSAVVDNIPVMFAVLTMSPTMSEGQWLLVTLTAGIGGSLLSIGSAAGVALMGQSRGYYTFFGHLKWTWAIALGYFAAIALHLYMNARLL